MKRKLLIAFGVVASMMAVTALALPTILHTVVDEEKRFFTGQNQNSGRETAQAMLALLAER